MFSDRIFFWFSISANLFAALMVWFNDGADANLHYYLIVANIWFAAAVVRFSK